MILYTLRNRGCNTIIKNLLSSHNVKINQLAIRSTSQSTNVYPDHQLVYKFPPIRIASLMNRLKLYQTVVTIAGIPVITAIAACGVTTYDMALLYMSSGITWCLSLFTVGSLGTNRVGFIHLRDDNKSVKISYADFWGRKAVVDIPVEDIWPIGDLPRTNPLYYKLKRYSTPSTLKFNIRHGVIVDADKFQLILGGTTDDKKF